jgi:hypothetical protein
LDRQCASFEQPHRKPVETRNAGCGLSKGGGRRTAQAEIWVILEANGPRNVTSTQPLLDALGWNFDRDGVGYCAKSIAGGDTVQVAKLVFLTAVSAGCSDMRCVTPDANDSEIEPARR